MALHSIAFVPAFRPTLLLRTTSSFNGSFRLSSTLRIVSANRVSRWRMNVQPDSSSSSGSPGSDPQQSATGADDDMYSLDTEALVTRAKEVFSDVSGRPVYYSKIGGYAVGAIVLITVLRAIVSAIDSLPVLPSALELIGLGYAGWFIWRYVLFRDTRSELLDEIDEFLGRTRPGGKPGE